MHYYWLSCYINCSLSQWIVWNDEVSSVIRTVDGEEFDDALPDISQGVVLFDAERHVDRFAPSCDDYGAFPGDIFFARSLSWLNSRFVMVVVIGGTPHRSLVRPYETIQAMME